MADIDQSLTSGISLPIEVLVPCSEPRERSLQKCSRVCLVLGVPVDVQRGGGMDGRLDHARGLAVTGHVRAALRMPEPYAWKVLAKMRIKDYLGQQPVLPLA